MEKVRADDDLSYYWQDHNLPSYMVESDSVLVQPVGFVWWGKPRFRIKSISRKIDGKSD